MSRPRSSSAGRDEASTRRSGVLDAHVDQWVDRHLATRKILRPRNAAYLIISVWVFAIVIFGVIERLVDPKTFPSVWLAFWWAIQTVTTVGYGDVVPKQTSGKFFAAILMLGGLSIISIITATVTSAFVTRRQAELQATGDDPVLSELGKIAVRLDGVEAELRRVGGGGELPPSDRPEPPSG